MSALKTFSSVAEAITLSTEQPFEPSEQSALSGGCISQAQVLTAKDGRRFFVKSNNLGFGKFFEAEAEALREIQKSSTVQVPQVIVLGFLKDSSFLVLSYIEEGRSTQQGQRELGRQLAMLHKSKKPYFGWSMDNCIGATPQPNPRSECWVDFYRHQRLAHQIDLAASKGATFRGSEDLLKHLEAFFFGYSPQPSLLHGDLWGGNASYDSEGKPFLFDPASYYGDRETDLAFTSMFGGFSSAFYEAYEHTYPMHSGFKTRKTLYNLYHELNHFNLFGGGYANSAQSSILQLTSQLP